MQSWPNRGQLEEPQIPTKRHHDSENPYEDDTKQVAPTLDDC